MPRKASRPKARDPGSFKGLLIRMNAEGWRELRILAAERDTTLNALAIEALNDLLKKRGKPAVVENPLIDEE
jgi:predicted HicB family RNase H-like nuclease